MTDRLVPRLLLASVLVALAGCASASPPAPAGPAPTDGPGLIVAMNARYAGRWYRTLSLTQDTYWATENGQRTEVWREWMALPGNLRVEMEDPLAGPDALYTRDSTFFFNDGALAGADAARNRLLVLGFDVYAQPPARTLQALQSEGIDLNAFRTDAWMGKPAFVVGTPATGEVWVEAERLLFVRLVEPGFGGTVRDVRFLRYVPLGQGWIAPRVEVWSEGALAFWEESREIQADIAVPPVLFDPRRWTDGVTAIRGQ